MKIMALIDSRGVEYIGLVTKEEARMMLNGQRVALPQERLWRYIPGVPYIQQLVAAGFVEPSVLWSAMS